MNSANQCHIFQNMQDDLLEDLNRSQQICPQLDLIAERLTQCYSVLINILTRHCHSKENAGTVCEACIHFYSDYFMENRKTYVKQFCSEANELKELARKQGNEINDLLQCSELLQNYGFSPEERMKTVELQTRCSQVKLQMENFIRFFTPQSGL